MAEVREIELKITSDTRGLENIEKKYNKASDSIKRSNENMASTFNQANEQIMIFHKRINDVEKDSSTFSNGFKTIGKDSQEALKTVDKSVDETINKFSFGVASVTSFIAADIFEIFEIIFGKFKQMIDLKPYTDRIKLALPFLKDFGNALADAFNRGDIKRVGELLKEFLVQPFKDLANTEYQNIRDILRTISDFGKDKIDGVKGIVRALLDAGKVRLEQFTEFLNRVKEFGKLRFVGFLDFIKNIGGRLQPVIDVVKNFGGVLLRLLETVGRSTAFRAFLSIISRIALVIGSVLSVKVLAIIAIIAALIGIIVLAVKHWDLISDAIGRFVNFVGENIGIAAGFIEEKFFQTLEFISGVWETLKERAAVAWESIKEAVGTAIEGIKGFFSGIGESLSNIWNSAKEKAAEVWIGITEIVSSAWESIKEIVGNAIEGILGFFGVVGERLSEIWESAKETASSAWEGLKEIVSGGVESIKAFFSGISETLGGVWDGAKEKASEAWEGIKGVVSGAVESIKEFGNQIKDSITKAFTDAFDAVKEFFPNLINDLKEKWDNFINSLPFIDFFKDGEKPEIQNQPLPTPTPTPPSGGGPGVGPVAGVQSFQLQELDYSKFLADARPVPELLQRIGQGNIFVASTTQQAAKEIDNIEEKTQTYNKALQVNNGALQVNGEEISEMETAAQTAAEGGLNSFEGKLNDVNTAVSNLNLAEVVEELAGFDPLSLQPGFLKPLLDSKDEVVQIADTFEETSERAQNSLDELGVFAADIASEINNTFADLIFRGLKGNLDSLSELWDSTLDAMLDTFAQFAATIISNPIRILLDTVLRGDSGSGGSGGKGFFGTIGSIFDIGKGFKTIGKGLSKIPGVSSIVDSVKGLFAEGGALAGIGTFLSEALPVIGAIASVVAFAIPIISGLFKKTPRLDIDFDSVKTEMGRRAAIVNEFLDEDFFKDSIAQISVKRSAGLGVGGDDKIKEIIQDTLEATIRSVQEIIFQLPSEIAAELNDALLNAEIDIDTVVAGERLLEFDAKGKKIKEKFEAFINGELSAKFLFAIRDFFEGAFESLGVLPENASTFIDDIFQRFQEAGSREARAAIGQEFLASFEALVNAFNIIEGNFGDAVGQTIQEEEWEYKLAA